MHFCTSYRGNRAICSDDCTLRTHAEHVGYPSGEVVPHEAIRIQELAINPRAEWQQIDTIVPPSFHPRSVGVEEVIKVFSAAPLLMSPSANSLERPSFSEKALCSVSCGMPPQMKATERQAMQKSGHFALSVLIRAVIDVSDVSPITKQTC